MWDWTEDKIKVKITWIRHGMTRANEEHRYLGKTDEPLSEKGIRFLQGKKKKSFFNAPEFLYASPMKRCVQTAEILFRRKPVLIPEWKEMDFGQFEGKNYEELKDNPDYQKWIDSNGTLPFPEGESQQEYIKRCQRGLHAATKIIEGKITGEIADAAMPLSKSRITELREPEKLIAENQMTENPITESQPRNVTAVVHGGTIMALLHILAGGNYFDYQVKNGGGYCCKLRLCGEEWKLDSFEEITI